VNKTTESRNMNIFCQNQKKSLDVDITITVIFCVIWDHICLLSLHWVIIWLLLWPPTSYSWPPAILFHRCHLFLFFSPPNLQVPLADCHQALPHVWWWPRFIKFGQKFGEAFRLKFGRPRTWNFGAISDNFTTWSRISLECNKTSSIRKWHCKLRTLLQRKT